MLSDYTSDEEVAGAEPVRFWQLPAGQYATKEPTLDRREGWAKAEFNPRSRSLPPKTAGDYWWRIGMLDLADKLPKCGGWAVVATNMDTLPYIITEGFLLDGADAVMEVGAASACHDNAARLVQMNPKKMLMMSGYALSDDGMWRGHSWCAKREDDGSFTIVETTCPRLAYFGHVVRRESTGTLFPTKRREKIQAAITKGTNVLKLYYQRKRKANP